MTSFQFTVPIKGSKCWSTRPLLSWICNTFNLSLRIRSSFLYSSPCMRAWPVSQQIPTRGELKESTSPQSSTVSELHPLGTSPALSHGVWNVLQACTGVIPLSSFNQWIKEFVILLEHLFAMFFAMVPWRDIRFPNHPGGSHNTGDSERVVAHCSINVQSLFLLQTLER